MPNHGVSIAGDILGGMGPGLLGGIGQALIDKAGEAGKTGPRDKKPPTAVPDTLKHGGTVQKTGLALVHKGEKVIPAKENGNMAQETVKLSKHRVVMHLNKGGLERALHVPENENIPKDKLEAAKNSKNPHMREMANLASNMSHWHKK